MGEFFSWIRVWRESQRKRRKGSREFESAKKKHEEQIEHIAEEGKYFIEEPKLVNSLFLEASATDETTSKQVKEDLKNPDTLSMVIKNVNSKRRRTNSSFKCKRY